jgi:DNA-binding MarR family transcriptional regulator
MKENLSLRLVTGVMATADAFLREGQKLFRPLGLTPAQYNVLNILAAQEGSISQRELGDHLVVDRSNVTGLLDRMETAGWVRREDDPDDRRVYRITLTAAGRKLWTRVHPHYLEIIAQVTRGLGTPAMRDCIVTLQQLEARAAQWKFPDDLDNERI